MISESDTPRWKRWPKNKGPFPSWEITAKRLVDGDIGLLDDPDGDAMIALARRSVDDEIAAARRDQDAAMEAKRAADEREAAALARKSEIDRAAAKLRATGIVDPILRPAVWAEIRRRLANGAAAQRKVVRKALDLARPNALMKAEGYDLQSVRIIGKRVVVAYEHELTEQELPPAKMPSSNEMEARADRSISYYFYDAPFSLGVRTARPAIVVERWHRPASRPVARGAMGSINAAQPSGP